MADKGIINMARKKRYIAAQIWLHYYNDYLFGKGIITEEARNKLRFKIALGARLGATQQHFP